MFKKISTSFINDHDGFSAKDFIMVIFAGAFIVQQVIVFALSLTGELNPQTLEVVRTLDHIVVTIVAGVFSLKGIETFRNRGDNQNYPPQDQNNIPG